MSDTDFQNKFQNEFLKHSGARYPIIGGAMYPCSNPELVAAVSEAGGLGVIQPLSLTFVHGYSLRDGIRKIKSLTKNPVGFNALIEASSKIYLKRMQEYVDIALEEGVRFFVTALGNPGWVIKKVEQVGGAVYHNTTEERFAKKVVDLGINGLICVNNRAGGHLGNFSSQELFQQLSKFKLPLVCAGGIGSPFEYQQALATGYQAVQMGTRFIASTECTAHEDYKRAIVNSTERDIVATERVTGIPLSVISNEYVKSVGLKANPLARFCLQNARLKHAARLYYSVLSFIRLKQSNFRSRSSKDYWQAGKSVAGIQQIKSCKEIIDEFEAL